MWYHKLNPWVQCHMGRGRDIARWDKRMYMDLFVGIFWEGPEEVIFKGLLKRIRPIMDSRDKSARDKDCDIWGVRASTCYTTFPKGLSTGGKGSHEGKTGAGS
ncbi:hypothetical protein Zmor_018108 [Zophobas morio]|uniref:Uncharacterized protein n=1 Tax=Zophobas morio TaxID=2755281 RepID=A0AA38IAY1_9CUCU|nr:hypothetical protein Zmor_018108 [Zophobas morio]